MHDFNPLTFSPKTLRLADACPGYAEALQRLEAAWAIGDDQEAQRAWADAVEATQAFRKKVAVLRP